MWASALASGGSLGKVHPGRTTTSFSWKAELSLGQARWSLSVYFLSLRGGYWALPALTVVEFKLIHLSVEKSGQRVTRPSRVSFIKSPVASCFWKGMYLVTMARWWVQNPQAGLWLEAAPLAWCSGGWSHQAQRCSSEVIRAGGPKAESVCPSLLNNFQKSLFELRGCWFVDELILSAREKIQGATYCLWNPKSPIRYQGLIWWWRTEDLLACQRDTAWICLHDPKKFNWRRLLCMVRVDRPPLQAEVWWDYSQDWRVRLLTWPLTASLL